MLTLVTAIALAGCATALLDPEERAQVCRVGVVIPADTYTAQENPLANPAGGVTGAGLGALSLVFAFPIGFLTAPIIAVRGIQCGVGSINHPNAQADFQAIYRSANASALDQGIEHEFDGSRAACSPAEPSGARQPDIVVDVQGIAVMPGCAYGDWEYQITVTWRVKRAASGAMMTETKTTCRHLTHRNVDDWFAHPEEGRAEFERGLGVVGKRMAEQLTAEGTLPACVLETLKGGAVVLQR